MATATAEGTISREHALALAQVTRRLYDLRDEANDIIDSLGVALGGHAPAGLTDVESDKFWEAFHAEVQSDDESTAAKS